MFRVSTAPAAGWHGRPPFKKLALRHVLDGDSTSQPRRPMAPMTASRTRLGTASTTAHAAHSPAQLEVRHRPQGLYVDICRLSKTVHAESHSGRELHIREAHHPKAEVPEACRGNGRPPSRAGQRHVVYSSGRDLIQSSIRFISALKRHTRLVPGMHLGTDDYPNNRRPAPSSYGRALIGLCAPILYRKRARSM